MGSLELLEKKSSLLKEISGAMVATGNRSVIDNLILDLAVSYTGAEKGSFMLLTEGGELSVSAARGGDFQSLRSRRVRLGEGIAGIVARNGTPSLVKDIEKDTTFQRENRGRYKTKSFISCPVISRSTLIGVLNVNDRIDGAPFTEDELGLLTIIANQAAMAIENATLLAQLNSKAADLEEINREFIDMDVVKTEFFARASHELRTPLNSIKGAIYYLLQHEKSPGSHADEFYRIISHETGKLIDIVENLLDFVGVDNRARVVRKSLISLPGLLKDIANSPLLKTKLARKNIRLNIAISESLPTVVGDRTKVAQFFLNLVEGLIHFLDSGDTMNITARDDNFVTISFALSRRLQESTISDFFTSRGLYQMVKGHKGLKLFLAWRFAEIHRWMLKAEDDDASSVISLEISKSPGEREDAVIGLAAELLLEFISELLELNICSIMLPDPFTNELVIRCARGLEDDVVSGTRVRYGNSIAGWVASEGKALFIEDIERDPRFMRRSIPQYNTRSLLVLPLKVRDKVIGVINLNNKRSAESFTATDLQIASVLSERVSYFIGNVCSGAYGECEIMRFLASLDALLSAVKAYHKKGRIFPELISGIMDAIGANDEAKKVALYVSMIYDLGLTPINGGLLKKGNLSPLELRMIRVHPYASLDLINGLEFSEDVKKAILHHHERYDGTGYPEKLKHDDIPFISRVLAVVDAFCALIAKRPYRNPFTREEAIREIEKGSGSVYDPGVVDALRKALSQ
jgi:GAF domain-containing protein